MLAGMAFGSRFDIASLREPAVGSRNRGARASASLVALTVLLPIGWFAAFASGIAPWLGQASVSTSSFGLPGGAPFSIIGHNETSSSFGLDTMLLFAGQEFYVRYETELRRGMLLISLGPPTRRAAVTQYRYVRASGAGEIVFAIPKTGIYEIRHDASPDGRGFDLDYRVSWGARPGR
jgi:hypothetical protein